MGSQIRKILKRGEPNDKESQDWLVVGIEKTAGVYDLPNADYFITAIIHMITNVVIYSNKQARKFSSK